MTIDIVLGLPSASQDASSLNAGMTVTCRSSKRMTFMPGRDNWDAPQWAKQLVRYLTIGDWGTPTAIISDRDHSIPLFKVMENDEESIYSADTVFSREFGQFPRAELEKVELVRFLFAFLGDMPQQQANTGPNFKMRLEVPVLPYYDGKENSSSEEAYANAKYFADGG
ncbi:hypothetical protein FQN55_009507 [Onygenales sp. PD_40]|nr:hypothetical protein FQN55_009507 [Onygenales sp. PD_40]